MKKHKAGEGGREPGGSSCFKGWPGRANWCIRHLNKARTGATRIIFNEVYLLGIGTAIAKTLRRDHFWNVQEISKRVAGLE